MTKKQIEAQKKRNARFQKMTPEQKRVAIAKDVIKALADKKIKATPGDYFTARNKKGDMVDLKDKVRKNDGLDLVLAEIPVCEVCALGATFVCAVSQANAIKAKDFIFPKSNIYDQNYDRLPGTGTIVDVGAYSMRGYLSQFFDLTQLYLIETAFEKCVFRTSEDSKLDYRALAFSASSNPTVRMRKIMNNIIKNNGTFAP